jgi:diguanylate cyclase (GGDEF)-like protein
MDIFSDVYKKWRRLFVGIAFILASISFIVEIIMSYYLFQNYTEMIKLRLVPYILLYIIVPSSLNFFIAIFGWMALNSTKISERSKNYISILMLSGICFVLSCVHNVYAVTSCSLCFPIYISILFSDQKLTKNISIISFFFICISIFFAKIDGRAHDNLLFINFCITIYLLINSYVASRYLIKLEAEKNILIKKSYEKQIQLEEKLKYDSLTNLYNMSTFYNLLDSTIENEEFPIAIAVIDVDNFKRINDTYGHEQGNQVLIYLAQLLQSHCSAMGHVFRYGGEEFSIILPNRTDMEAKLILEDIQYIFENHSFEFMTQGNITFSCGIASSLQKSSKPKELFHMADKAMYEAKSTGKNKTILFKEI